MRCSRCGANNDYGKLICENCGAVLPRPKGPGPVLSTSSFFLDHGSTSSVALLTFLFVLLMLCGSIGFVGYKVLALMPEPSLELTPPGGEATHLPTRMAAVSLVSTPSPSPSPTATPAPDAEGIAPAEDSPELQPAVDATTEPESDEDPPPSPDFSSPTPAPEGLARRAPSLSLPTIAAGQQESAYRISQVRYSGLPGRARIVLDLTLRPFTLEKPTYSIDNTPERITIHLGVSAARWLGAPEDAIVSRIEIAPTSASSADLILDLAQPVSRITDALLTGPDSLVFDCYVE